MDVMIVYNGKERPYAIQPETTLNQFRNTMKKIFNIPGEQLSLSYISQSERKVVMEDDQKTLSELGIIPKSKISIKDMGKQIKWEYVFYIQYLGPIIIIPLFYFFGKRSQYQLVHHTAAFMAVTHFVKRQLQTKFIHVFSRKTMPFKRVFINSAHYWILFAFLNGIQLFIFPKPMKWDSNDVMILFIIWATLEFCNFKSHVQLSDIRKNDKKKKGIPKKWGFKFVSCANYLWETLGWLTFSILTKCYSSFLFTGISAAQMVSWALKKHRTYKKQFGDQYPKNRKAIFPYIL